MITSFKTAEYVSPKHPDKICNRIADAILDAHLLSDSLARVAIEVVGGHGQVVVMGEVTSSARVDTQPIVARIAGDGLKVTENIITQSPGIARGVDTGGAGDQGIMIGYASNETPELLPLEYVLARDLNRQLYDKYDSNGKTQITIKGHKLPQIVASFQHTKQTELLQVILA